MNNIQLIPPSNFQQKLHNKQVNLFTLKNKQGTTTQITNFGGRVVNLWVKDKHGNYQDIVLGYDNLDGYLNSNESYFGALIGRYANRIANAQFTLNNTVYHLEKNNGNNHLHGGSMGFHNQVWDAKQMDAQTLELSYLSKDEEEGFSGNLSVKVAYTLTDNNALKISYTATTDKATPVNFTHHSFFNLKGTKGGNIGSHLLKINATKYTPIDSSLIPIGVLANVDNTLFDFRKPKAISQDIHQNDEQLNIAGGYDHSFAVEGEGFRLAASLYEPSTGIGMEVWTDTPAMQVYSGNFLNGKDIGKEGKVYECQGAVCLETQHFPDSPNQACFPSTILEVGEVYEQCCVYRFKRPKILKL